MLFPTLLFLAFFAVVFTVYWSLSNHRHRLLWLLFASLYFYASWNLWLITLIVFSASVDYTVALILERVKTPWRRRALLILSIATNLSLLAFFKYVNFFLDTVYTVQGFFGVTPSRAFLDIVLPLGISFYTFETISYIVDVYQGKVKPVRNLLDYALYIMFFPHLVAGPIVRPRDFLPQIRRRKTWNWDRMQLGLQLFFLGLFKKAVLADHLAAIVDPIFKTPEAYGSSAVWLGVLGYAAQIYCDFSGYSDMAIGLAHMLGFHLPANFNMPYFAANIAEFWRRWHISLSRWLRDYLYIPLGGARKGTVALCRNLILTMLLGGLWHGASWTFIVWGLYHGALLALHKVIPWPQWLGRPWAKPLCVATTFFAFCIGLVFFRAQSFGDAGTMLQHMFASVPGQALDVLSLTTVLGVLAIVFVGHLAGTFLDTRKWERRLPAPALGMGLAALVLLIFLFIPEDGKAFIYFQF